MLLLSTILRLPERSSTAGRELRAGMRKRARSMVRGGKKHEKETQGAEQEEREERAAESRELDSREPGEIKAHSQGGVITGIALIIYLIYAFGVFTIWSRANPEIRGFLRIAALVFILLFADLYMFYFAIRFAVFGAQGKADEGYVTLHKPTAYFSSKRV